MKAYLADDDNEEGRQERAGGKEQGHEGLRDRLAIQYVPDMAGAWPWATDDSQELGKLAGKPLHNELSIGFLARGWK